MKLLCNMMSMMMMMMATLTVQVVVVVAEDPPDGMISLLIHRPKSSGDGGGDDGDGRRLALFDETALFKSSVFIYCGTPPQRRDVQIDTGSYDTAFICTGCNKCGTTHFDPYFDPSKSSTFEKVGCDVCNTGNCSASSGCLNEATYGDGDHWVGYEAIDQCFVAGDYPNSTVTSSLFTFNFTFTCQTTVTGSFLTTEQDGITGLANTSQSFWTQLYDAGKIKNRMFSVCYAPSLKLLETDPTQSLDVGTLTLGGSDSHLRNTSLVYTNNALDDSIFYRTTLRRVYLQGGNGTTPKVATLNLNQTQLNSPSAPIVDSGTTFTSLTPVFFNALNEAWLAVTGSPYDPNATFTSPDEFSHFPTIFFQLVGDDPSNAGISPSATDLLAGSIDPEHPLDVIIAFPPFHYIQAAYFFVENGTTAEYAPVISFNQKDYSILGANFMMGHDIFFDLENNRLGWADSDCDFSKLAAATVAPVTAPTTKPTAAPVAPTAAPVAPTAAPVTPTAAPVAPTAAPVTPTAAPTAAPVATTAPVAPPSTAPVAPPSPAPVAPPSPAPVAPPSPAPVAPPTTAPVKKTAAPVKPKPAPVKPTAAPVKPTVAPVKPTAAPVKPTVAPVKPTAAPVKPTAAPVKPTVKPVAAPTNAPVLVLNKKKGKDGKKKIAVLGDKKLGGAGGR